jgi:hypothetical protein
MEPGEEPRHRVAAAKEDARQAASASRISITTIIVAALIVMVLFGWLFAR